MRRWPYYRLPIVFLAVAILALARPDPPTPDDALRIEQAASRTLETRYPDLPAAIYARGLRALQRQDWESARRDFETALAARYYTDESLLHNYALLLIHLRRPGPEIDRAAELWRKHFPHSKNPDPRRYVETARRF